MPGSGAVGRRPLSAGVNKARFAVDVTPLDGTFFSRPDAQVVFHGINKSGSLAMSRVLREAYAHARRRDEVRVLNRKGQEAELAFLQAAEDDTGPGFYYGHNLFGALAKRPGRYWVTLLRDPLPRAVSCYHWLKSAHPEDSPRPFPSLEEFVERTQGVHHSQAVQLGLGYSAAGRAAVGQTSMGEVLELAKHAIETEISVLGLAEYFEPSIFLFAHLVGLKSVLPWQRDVRNKGRPDVASIPDETVALIREVYRYDFALYEWAVARFFRQLESVRFGDSLAAYEETCSGAYRERHLSVPEVHRVASKQEPQKVRGAAPNFAVVIPARFASTRLPGKPLRTLLGKPLVLWVHERALGTGAELVAVATDDERIAEVVESAGGKVFRTRSDHATGTDRLAEVVNAAELADDTIVVNLQGDEPLVSPELVKLLVAALERTPTADIATLATPLGTSQRDNPNIVKVVTNQHGFALYFSRYAIPFRREEPSPDAAGDASHGLRHLGLYAYRARTLRALSAQPPVQLEQCESLEQLRALWLGSRILVLTVGEAPGHGVDTEEDLRRVEAELQARTSV